MQCRRRRELGWRYRPPSLARFDRLILALEPALDTPIAGGAFFVALFLLFFAVCMCERFIRNIRSRGKEGTRRWNVGMSLPVNTA